MLSAARKQRPQEAAPVAAAEPAEPAAAEQSEPDQQIDAQAADLPPIEEFAPEQPEEVEQDAEPVEPELLELFGLQAQDLAALPQETRRALIEREQQRSQEVQQLQAAYSEISQHLQILQDVAPTLDQIMADRWDGIDWDRLAQEDPQAYWAYKAQYDREIEAATAAKAAQAAQETQARRQALAQERQALLKLVPEFADPQKAQAAVAQMRAFARAVGVSAETLANLNAAETYVLHLATQAHQAQRALKTRRTNGPPPKATPPSSAQPGRSKTTLIAEADRRLSQTGSVDDALALLRAKRGR